MQFTNDFDVSVPPEAAWPLLMDIERIVPCMPGAELIEVIDDKTFKGKVGVKLGPVALVFVCNAVFEEVDNEARFARIKANGSDSKGRGNANTIIQFKLLPSATGTKVTIDTDLTLSGAVAQYGRGVGMIRTVANQIISQFSNNLEALIALDKEDRASQAQACAGAGAPAFDGETAIPPANENAVAGAASATASASAPPQPRPTSAPAKPISGFSLLFSSLWSMVRGWFGGGSSR